MPNDYINQIQVGTTTYDIQDDIAREDIESLSTSLKNKIDTSLIVNSWEPGLHQSKEIVLYNNKLYRCKSNISDSRFSPPNENTSGWEEIILADISKDIKKINFKDGFNISIGTSTDVSVDKGSIGLSKVINETQIPISIGTTTGDIIYYISASTPTILTIGEENQILSVSNKIPIWKNEYFYTLPIATSTELGGIKIGDGLSIDNNGIVSVSTQSSGGGGGTWGSITGTISDQTDLQAALNAKANTADMGGIQVRPNYIISDTDLTDGVSALASGVLYLYYEV